VKSNEAWPVEVASNEMAFDGLHPPPQGGVGTNQSRVGLWVERECVVAVKPILSVLSRLDKVRLD
jgi:hypothetical protein